MKNIRLLFLCMMSFAFIFTACDCDKEGPEGSGDIILNVNVVNGNDFSIDSVCAFLYHPLYSPIKLVSAPYNNGNFSIALPHKMHESYLQNVLYMEKLYAGVNLTFSNKDANVLDFKFALAAYKDGLQSGHIVYSEYPPDSYYYMYYTNEATLTYSDRPVVITGSKSNGTEKQIVNINFNTGWNIIRTRDFQENGSHIIEITTNNVSGLNWYWDKYRLIP